MARKHRAHEEEHENAERWLLTYADMITLLMCLFIVLYAMSVLNKSKFEAFQNSFHKAKATGQPDLARPALKPTTKPQPPTPPVPLADVNQLKVLQQQIQHALATAGLSHDATVQVDNTGLTVNITAGVLFDTGEAVLLPEGVKVLAVVAPRIATVPNPVVVEGHTDNQPIVAGPYPSNWELSTARAGTVVRWLLQDAPVLPSRLTATGYADTRPVAPDDTPAHRALNRRVVLIVKAAGTPA